jgi:hypothetical protein
MSFPHIATSPGLAKVRTPPLVLRRSVELARASPGRWAELVDDADVVSEGRATPEAGRVVYYGSTSVLLLMRSAGGALPDAEIGPLARILACDPHVRVRILRVAAREARARAGGVLGTMRAEIDVSAGARGVLVLVEVVAHLARQRDETLARVATLGTPEP